MSNSNARLYFLVARSPMHLGCDDSLGFIDKPTKRQVATRHPMVPGSTLKGCLGPVIEQAWGITENQRKALVGVEGVDGTGMLCPQDAHLLLLPVASWAGGWAWATAPAVLHRLRRAAAACNVAAAAPRVPEGIGQTEAFDRRPAQANAPVQRALALQLKNATNNNTSAQAGLAEEVLNLREDDLVNEWADWLARHALAGEDPEWVEQFKQRLVVVADVVFDDLAQTCTDVRARNKLGADGVTVNHHLWREECVPEDALFFGQLSTQTVASNPAGWTEQQALASIQALEGLQLGGKASVGYGWASFRPMAMAATEVQIKAGQ